MDRESVMREIKKKSCIAIVRGVEAESCPELAEALCRGGISLIEVTFDQKSRDGYDQTLEGIRLIRERMGESVCVGAGTVMTKEQVRLAREAGAGFLISPHVDVEIIGRTVEQGMVSIPGALTPTEAALAWQAGASFVKIFPAGEMGPSYIRAVKAPLGHIPFLAVGGVNEENVRDFLGAGACGVGIGGNLVNRQWIREKHFERITALAGKITEQIEMYREAVCQGK